MIIQLKIGKIKIIEIEEEDLIQLVPKNISKYNDILGDPIDPKAFDAKNDLEFNRIIADQRELKRKQEKLNPDLTNEILKQNQELEDDMKKKRENDLNRQKWEKGCQYT